jgi:exopolysaccharide production protein ExoZ
VRKFQSVQSLRFFAAALVLGAHVDDRLTGFGERYGFAYHRVGFSGRFGVDIFFVISGFIMAWLCVKSFGMPGAPRRFILDRITRIVPLYWLCTAAAIVLALLAAKLGDPDRAGIPTVAKTLKSLFFIPYFESPGKHRPVMGQGWTLDFEMLFYAILALCLLLQRTRGFIVLSLAFAAVFALGFIPNLPVPLRIWSDPIIFEFLAGIALALIRLRTSELIPIRMHPVLLVIPIVIVTAFRVVDEAGSLVNAVTATTLVALCVLGRDQGNDRLSRATAALGDWSYSLYLTHGFALLLVGIFWRRAFGAAHLWAYAAIVIAGSIALAYGSFVCFEKPITRYLRRSAGVESIRKGAVAIG